MENATYIPSSWDLPDAIRLRLGKTVGKQRLICENDHHLLLLHQAPRAESANQQAISSEAANQEARRLNRLAAFFFPLATLVAVFGMNPPEQIYPHPGFWIVLAAGIVLGFIVHGVVALSNRKQE